jgi:hypothetical protein
MVTFFAADITPVTDGGGVKTGGATTELGIVISIVLVAWPVALVE